MICKHCGVYIPDDAQFCENCCMPVTNNTQKEYVQQSIVPENEEWNKSVADIYRNNKKEPGHKGMILAVILSIVFAAAAVGIFIYTISNYSGNNILTSSAAASPTPDTGAAQTAAAANQNNAIMETYYVANCKQTIPLRSAPSNTATVLKTIPLGAPVSFAETAQDGFAKIVYDGETGYTLQSYLSKTPPVNTQQSYSGNYTGGTSSNNTNTSSKGAVYDPSYSIYHDSYFGFSCYYPSHFEEYNDSDSFVRYSVKAPDGTARLKICAKANSSNLSIANILSNFKSDYPGYVDYENSGNNWCALSTNDSSGYCHYAYFHVDSSIIRGFEFHYDKTYETIYDRYVEDIYDSIAG